MKSIILAACLSLALLFAALAHRGTWLPSEPAALEHQDAQSFGSAYDVGNWKRKLEGIEHERHQREDRVLQALDPVLAERAGQPRE